MADDLLLPVELAQALESNAKAKAAFTSMPHSHKREYIDYVKDANQPETRLKRAKKAAAMIIEWQEKRGKP